jgi:hypothetical protein
MEPGTGSPLVERFFNISVVVLVSAIVLVFARTAYLMGLLWIMPVAKLVSFIPGIRRWIERRVPRAEDGDANA